MLTSANVASGSGWAGRAVFLSAGRLVQHGATHCAAYRIAKCRLFFQDTLNMFIYKQLIIIISVEDS